MGRRFWLLLMVLFMLHVPRAQGSTHTQYKVGYNESPAQIATKFGLTVQELWVANPSAKSQWKQGLVLLLPQKIKLNQNAECIEVHAQDTWYGLSKQCGCTVAKLQECNPDVFEKGLQPGMRLRCNKPLVPSNSKEVEQQTSTKVGVAKTAQPDLKSYIVQPKDTWYSIARKHLVAVEVLQQCNKDCPETLPIGYELKIPNASSIPTRLIMNDKKIQRDTLKPVVQTAAKPFTLWIALPLHLYKKSQDSTETIADRLKKDKLLNVALDFYAGALKAVDSAKVLGYPIRVKIVDSEETKNGSSWSKWQNDTDWNDAAALVGPFFQQQVQMWAQGLKDKGVKVYSPLSKEPALGGDNVFQTQPDLRQQRLRVAQYLQAQNAQVLVLADPKKASLRAELKAFDQWSWVGLTDKGGVVADSLRKQLSKSKLNYMVLATEKTSQVTGLLRAIKVLSKTYQIRLASLEASETLEFDEVPIEQLNQFQLVMPQSRKMNSTPAFEKFKLEFRKVNKVIPNEIAIRGFDVVFDVIERHVQQLSPETATERWENRFEYHQNAEGIWENDGTYLWQFQSDGTPKMTR